MKKIIFEIKMNGEWVGKLTYWEIGEIQEKGYKCFSIEGAKYLITL